MPDVPVRLTDDQTVDGADPLVILGPNGAGKTRFAIELTKRNNGEMIPALRNIALPTDIPMRSLEKAKKELRERLNRRRQKPWELSNEINELFGKLMAEDSAAAMRFRNEYMEGRRDEKPELTKLMLLQQSWLRLFPGRHIGFEGHHPVVVSDYSSSQGSYPAAQMSDGERVSLYLAGRVLDTDRNIIVIDEPEVHFHSRLAARFWNEMERLRPDARFIYVTHDLPFALSRSKASYAIVLPNRAPQVIELEEGLPSELSESLLSAASFSIYAKRIVFCEGDEGTGLDQSLYTSWFHTVGTAVVPVGSSSNALRSADAFARSHLVAGVHALGIIDRDYWPEDYLVSLPEHVQPLLVHEVENLYCLPEVFEALARHLGHSREEASEAHDRFISRARSKFSDELFVKQVTERVKRRCEYEFRKSLANIGLVTDSESLLRALDPGEWETPATSLVEEENRRLVSALEGSNSDFHRFFPGKVFLADAARELGVSKDRYCELVSSGLLGEDEAFAQLSTDLADALAAHLPERSLEPVPEEAEPGKVRHVTVEAGNEGA